MKKGDRGKTAKASGAPEDEFLEDEEEGNEQEEIKKQPGSK